MARLRLTEKADKDIDKLARPVKGAMWDFMRKFRQDPASPGLFLASDTHQRIYDNICGEFAATARIRQVLDCVWVRVFH